jgi:cytochrome P450
MIYSLRSVTISPGRFYAVNEMKVMLAIFISRYEIKAVPGTAPKQTFLATMAIPDTQLKTLVKRRET